MKNTQEQEYVRPSWLQGWHAFDSRLQKLERGLLVCGIFTILLVGSIHILARNLIGQGLAFSDVLAQHLTVWLGLLGATLAAASSEHISIDAFSRVLRGRGLQVNKLVIGAVSTLLCGVLTYRTIVFLLFYTQSKTMEHVHLGTWNVPIWYFLLIFPYAFGLITIRYLMQTIEYGLRPAHTFVQEQDIILAEIKAAQEAETTNSEAVSDEESEAENSPDEAALAPAKEPDDAQSASVESEDDTSTESEASESKTEGEAS